jgi:FkbM family methyltransferase
MFERLEKVATIFGNTALARGALLFGVAGAVEHLDVIAYLRPRHLIDVGANKGQFALASVSLDPAIEVDCFEPLPASAIKLERWAKATSTRIRVHRVALAAKKGTAEFHVTTREDSSSLFRPTSPQEAMGVRVKDTIEVATDRLDTQLRSEEVLRPSMLKIDVQGGELGVLQGASELLDVIDHIYLEVSFIELYENQPLFAETDTFLRSYGYSLRGIANGHVSRALGPLQADALYSR